MEVEAEVLGFGKVRTVPILWDGVDSPIKCTHLVGCASVGAGEGKSSCTVE